MKLKFVLKKETIKELGKVFFDISKIIIAVLLIAVSIITPLVKGDVSIIHFLVGFIAAIIIIYLFNKGVEK